MGLQFEGIGNVYVFLFIIFIGETWNYIDKQYMDNYICPPYCSVDHQHDMELSGRFKYTRDVWYSNMHDDSIWVLYMASDSVHTKRLDGFNDNEFSEAGRNNN